MLFNAAKLLIISLTTKHFSPFSFKKITDKNSDAAPHLPQGYKGAPKKSYAFQF